MSVVVAKGGFPSKVFRGLCTIVGLVATAAIYVFLEQYVGYRGALPETELSAASAAGTSYADRVVAVTATAIKVSSDTPPPDYLEIDPNVAGAFMAERCARYGKSSSCTFWRANQVELGGIALSPALLWSQPDAAPSVTVQNNIELKFWPAGRRYTVFAGLSPDGRALLPVSFPGPWPQSAAIIADVQDNPLRYGLDRAATAHGRAWGAFLLSTIVFLFASRFTNGSHARTRQLSWRHAAAWTSVVAVPNLVAMALSYSPWFFHVNLLPPLVLTGLLIWFVRQMMRYFDSNLLG